MVKAQARVTMYAKLFMCVIGAAFIVHQVKMLLGFGLMIWTSQCSSQKVTLRNTNMSYLVVEEVYIAELMVESNVTVEAQTVLSALDQITELQVTDGNGNRAVTMQHNELVAECLIYGDDIQCNCSKNYIWSNEVCYTYNCCSEATCNQNVSYITPLCVAKVEVHINGSVTLKDTTWDPSKTTMLEHEFEGLNGFKFLNVTGQRLSNTIADFEATVSVKFLTSKLQDIVTALETKLEAVLLVDTLGLVTIESPNSSVCYNTAPTLKCTFEEETGSAGWNISRDNERLQLDNGIVVKLDTNCATDEYKSCIGITLQGVTGIWAGTYECGFTSGSVRHTAKSKLQVALLPDEIILKADPITVDCPSEDPVDISITATIRNSMENYIVSCSSMQKRHPDRIKGDDRLFSFTARISCKKDADEQSVTVTFLNSRNQAKKAEVKIPVIYVGSGSCPDDWLDGDFWPKTPYDDTAINRTCPEGTTGYKSRTCQGRSWQPVFYYCVNQELNKIVSAADNFQKGLGASQEEALNIFAQLKNNSAGGYSDSTETMANINASIDILEKMARASENVVLNEEIFDDFIHAASNMLSSSWNGVNNTIVHDMSSTYLQSVENLVKNIRANTSDGINSENIQLKICSSSNCSVPSFDVSLNLNMSSGKVKTLAVKNLTDKLRNNFRESEHSSLLVSATLENNSDSSLEIVLDFPAERQDLTKRLCVFWNTTDKNWSEAGCTLKTTNDGNRTFCQCNHLTSFSVLMAKGDISSDTLDIITNVGLGVSICSLLIFLTVESLVWSAVVKSNLSLFRHTALVNIAVFLLLADCCFLASSSPKSLSDDWCLILTICKHLFFLAMFSWMLCMSVMLVHQLIFVFSPLRKRVFMFLSSIVGYVCPIVIVGCSYVYSKYTNTSYYSRKTCWLVFKSLLVGSIHAFLLPVGTIILANLFSMVVVMITLVKSSVPDKSKADDKETVKSIIKVVVFLTPVFGLTWIIGFAQLMLDEKGPFFQVAIYSFTILNSFQGLFLLLTGVFAEQKVREEMFKLIMAKSKGKSESMKNLTSTTYTKDK
ncbi:adhesion G protein-coupled receptor F4 [Labrus mixtus]|uniref:adhesion G protein-coupled receptor F4 n=1 Tax=Labrus mixtus TaxID=508554 RepID=UPI0029C0E48E|nr:adhesion G protein-coupled receptor F4 [Labrus mixtus]